MGEILLRGDPIMQGYWRKPQITAETLRHGWLHTGDLGSFDDEGNFYFEGRKVDIIKSGGLKVAPREVEEVIATHPSVLEVAVVGVPDETWGEMVTAFVVARPGHQVAVEELREFCSRRLAGFKRPKDFHLLASLPKDMGRGKILKTELRTLALSRRQ